MTRRSPLRLALVAALWILAAAGCGKDTGGLQPAPPNTDPVVFSDDFGAAVDFQAFLNSKLDAVSIDTSDKHQGTASLKITVPSSAAPPTAGFAGGAFTTSLARDLSGYNALTFWAKSSIPATLDVVGLGNDNTGTSKYEAKWSSIPVTSTWTQYVVPIPLPAKLNAEGGLFYFAEGPENGAGYDLWFDEVRFDSVATISNPRPSINSQSMTSFVGATVSVQGTKVTFDVGGTDELIDAFPGYFTFVTSNANVLAIVDGAVHVVGAGNATVTAKLGDVDASGAVTVDVLPPPPTAAPTPTVAAANVIALFSNAYSSVPVDTWSASWDMADVADAKVAGDDVKIYTSLVYAGIEFTSNTIDAAAMTHFHVDVWVPSGSVFKVKLVDFGADGAYGGVDDREHELTFNASTTPSFVAGSWASLEIPLSSFTNLTTRAHLAQLILSGNASTAYVDNVYFHK